MNVFDQKTVTELIFPKRIVKTCGKIERAETLLVEKTLVVNFNENVYAKCSSETKKAYIVLDFGKEVQGGIYLALFGGSKPTLKLRLTFGESVSEALSNIGEKGATNDHSPRDIEVTVSQTFAGQFGQTGFRFVKIELEENCSLCLKGVAAVHKMQDLSTIGYIKTDDELLNSILDTAIYTCRLNIQDGVIWDGVKRDRFVWTGDLYAELLTAIYVYGNIPNIKNSLEILKNSADENQWINGIPSYSAWWIINLFTYCKHSGDISYMQENIHYVNTILQNFDRCIAADGTMDFCAMGMVADMPFYLDWPTYETKDAIYGTALLIAYMLETVEKTQAVGLDSETVKCLIEKLAVYKTKTVNKKQTLALQVLCGATPLCAQERLEYGGAKGFTTFMSYFLLNALHETGSVKTLDILKEYYGGMLSRGATTFWEDFDVEWLDGSGRIDEETPVGLKDLHADFGRYCYKGLRHSLCHGWSSGVVAYAFEKLLGLQILETGYKKVRIKPNLCGLRQIEGVIPTPYGNIEIFYDGKTERVKLPNGIERV